MKLRILVAALAAFFVSGVHAEWLAPFSSSRTVYVAGPDEPATTPPSGVIACWWDTDDGDTGTMKSWNPATQAWVSGGVLCSTGGSSITSIVPGTGATNLGKARSSSAGATDTGFAPWAVRDDALSTVAEDEGEYTPLKATSTGGLWMSIATPLGDSAMDDTANAVKTIQQANASSGTLGNVDVDNTVGNIVVTIDTGAIAASRCVLTFLNEDEAANATIDEWFFFLNPENVDSTENVTAYTEADFASPSGQLLFVRTGAPSGEADASPDTTLDETDVLTVIFDVGGIDNLVVEAGATADEADVTYWYTCN